MTWSFLTFLAIATTPFLADCRLLLDQGAGSLTETPAGGRSCATVCPTPLLLASSSLSKQPTSYACTAQNLPGFQSGSGATTCVVADASGKVVEAQNYSCLCMAPSQLQGLGKSDSAGSCASSCPTRSGQLGAPVVASSKNVCLATTEVGTTNHFGYTTAAGCTYADSAQSVQTSSAFSCVCAYGGVATPAPLAATLVALGPESSLSRTQVQLPTAG